MKKLMSFLIAILSGYLLYCQSIHPEKLPSDLKKNYITRFPEATNARWNIEEDRDYTVRFHLAQQQYFARFTREGSWIETKHEIDAIKLPKDVLASIRFQFPGFEIEDAVEVETFNNGINYELELENDDETYNVLISEKGKILLKVIEDESN